MKVELSQRFHKLGDVENNFNILNDTFEKSKADLVIFPELFLTGYYLRDKYQKYALSLDDDLIYRLSSSAKKNKRGLIFGMPEKHPEMKGLIYNTAVYINPEGKVDAYRKMHLVNFGPFEEKRYFTPGKEVRVMEINSCNFGIITCYDIFFPELTKLYALQGADMIIQISASPAATKIFFQKVMVARAIENTVFHLFSNLIGTERNLVFWGGNTVVGPRGEIQAQAKEFDEDNLVYDLDLSELKVARENRPTLRDTRFELFEATNNLGKIKF